MSELPTLSFVESTAGKESQSAGGGSGDGISPAI